MVLEYAKMLYPETRAAVDITDSEVLPITKDFLSVSTRAESLSEIPDTSFYIFNFPDESGYAVASANTKYGHSLICLTEKGSLTFEYFYPIRTRASADSTGLEGGTGLIADLICASIMANEIAPPIDSTEVGGGPSGNVGPYLKTKWTQNISPFNDKTDSHYPCGCTVLAVAQIMAFEEYSNTMVFDGVNCSWSDMKTVYTYPNQSSSGTSTGKNQVASFVKELGSSNNCSVTYGTDGTGGTDVNAKRALSNYGYSVTMTPALLPSPNFTHNMHSLVRTQLFSGHPVYVGGYRSGGIGHAWVIDGYYAGLYHINWGSFGMNDGYFEAGVFSIADPVDYASIDPETMRSETFNYSYGYHILTYTL